MTVDYTPSEAKEFAKQHMRGVFSAICVPETADEQIDELSLRRDLRHCVDVIGSGGIYLHGYYGNFWLLTMAERKRVVEVAVDEVDGRVPIMARCAHASLKEAIELARHAERTGADVISMIGPEFGGEQPDMVYEFIAAVASETRLGISVFNTAHAGYLMSPELLARLATIPNVVALKNAAPIEHTAEVRQLVGDELLVVDPYEDHFLDSMLSAGQQLIYTYANYLYDTPRRQPMKDYVDAGLAGDDALARKLFTELEPMRQIQEKWVRAGWRRLGHCPVSIVKTWCGALGMAGGPVRRPLPVITDTERQELLADLDRVGLTR